MPARSPRAVTARLRLAFLALLAVGCTTLTPAGWLAALRISPLSADPAALRVGVALPTAVRLRTGDAVLRFAYYPEDASFRTVDEAFELVIEAAADLPGAAPDDALYAAGLATADMDRLAAAQARVREMKILGDDGVGTLQLRLRSACHIGPSPGTVPFQSWLRTTADGRWVPLTRRVDLLETLGEEAGSLATVFVPCEARAQNRR